MLDCFFFSVENKFDLDFVLNNLKRLKFSMHIIKKKCRKSELVTEHYFKEGSVNGFTLFQTLFYRRHYFIRMILQEGSGRPIDTWPRRPWIKL